MEAKDHERWVQFLHHDDDPQIQIVLIEGKISSAINKSFSKPVDLSSKERIVYE